jgi:glycosyltransferase involved in cell wall biosynthesis
MFVANKHSDDPAVEAFSRPMDWPGRLQWLLRRGWLAHAFERYSRSRPSGYENFSDARSEHGATPWRQLPECDVLNLHWIAGFADYRSFLAPALGRFPVVWTLHDMNPFTGGCHFSYGCFRYRESCGLCPQLGATNQADLSAQLWKLKYRALERVDPSQLHIVAPSQWMATEVKKSRILGRFPISVIPYSLSTDEFVPRERETARSAISIPQDAKVLLFVSDVTENRRKGFSQLVETLTHLTDIPGLFLLSLGRGTPAFQVSDVQHVHLQHIGDDRLLALVYSAADLFVIPSLQDNLPNTVLESMACGTPVVGFDVGGIPDMVRPGKTGLLAPAGDVNALLVAISQLLHDHEMRVSMSATCRRVAVEEYRLEVQAHSYAELYKSMGAE